MVDLSRVSVLSEMVVRGGNVTWKTRTDLERVRATLRTNYAGEMKQYPDTLGLSTVFREGASLDELVRAGHFPHPKVSYSIVQRLIAELGSAGYEMVLYITPVPELPDHHSLAVAMRGIVQSELPDDAADALIRALIVIDNPYRRQK